MGDRPSKLNQAKQEQADADPMEAARERFIAKATMPTDSVPADLPKAFDYRPWLAIAIVAHSVLYLAMVFAAGLMTGNKGAMIGAIMATGLSYLSESFQLAAHNGKFETSGTVAKFGMGMGILSVVIGAAAGLSLI